MPCGIIFYDSLNEVTMNSYPRVRYPDLRDQEILDLAKLYKAKEFEEFNRRVVTLTGKFSISLLDDRIREIGETMERFMKIVTRDVNYFMAQTVTDPEVFTKKPETLNKNVEYTDRLNGREFLELFPEVTEALEQLNYLSRSRESGNKFVLDYVHYSKDGDKYLVLEGCHRDEQDLAQKI